LLELPYNGFESFGEIKRMPGRAILGEAKGVGLHASLIDEQTS
jgi:hypothetical protein